MVLEIRIPKDKYAVGEEIKGEHYLKYDGEPFRALINYCISKEGTDCMLCSRTRGVLDNIDFDKESRLLNVAVQAAEMYDQRNLTICLKDQVFQESGTYTYTMAVFKCEDVERELGVTECGWRVYDLKEGLLNMNPIKSTSKTITVYATPYSRENIEASIANSLKKASTNLASVQFAENIIFSKKTTTIKNDTITSRADIGLRGWQTCISPGQFFDEDEVEVSDFFGFDSESKELWKVLEDGGRLNYTGEKDNFAVGVKVICHSSATALKEFIKDYLDPQIKENWMHNPEKGFKCTCLDEKFKDQKCCLIALSSEQ